MQEYTAIYCRGDDRAEYPFEAQTLREALQHAREKYSNDQSGLCFSAEDNADFPLDKIILKDDSGEQIAVWTPLRDLTAQLLAALTLAEKLIMQSGIEAGAAHDVIRAAILKAQSTS
jgi:hypothetical protein